MKVSALIVLGVSLALAGCDSAPHKTDTVKMETSKPDAVVQAPIKPAPAEPTIETLAEFPHGTFLENLTVSADEKITFTSYFDKTVLRLNGRGPTVAFAKLDVHPICIVPVAGGYVVTAHGKAFTEGPDFTATNVILVLDASGNVKSRTLAPNARFLNGASLDSTGQILIADSLAGVIWRFNPVTGSVSQWFNAPELTPDPAAKGFALGANGLKIRQGAAYVSNTSRGTLYKIAIDANGKPERKAEIVARTGNIDDFDFSSDGTIYVATHEAEIKRVSPDLTVETFLAKGCDGCTSLAVSGQDAAQRLIVLTTGNWGAPDDKTPARVLSVSVPPQD